MKHYHTNLNTRLICLQFILFLFSMFWASRGEAQYEWRTVSPLPTGNTINGVAFPSSSKAIAVGNSGTVIISEDAGLNWYVSSPSLTFSNLTIVDVDFADANNGYIMLRGGDGVMKTNSGGEGSWVSANGNGAGISGINSTTAGKEIQVLDANTVVTINSVRAYITTDGGDVWTDITPPGLGSSPRFEDIYFLNATTGYILTRGSGVFKTTDGGSNWTQLTGFTGIQASIVYFENETNGWIVEGTNSTLTNTIYRTTDGGTTWTSQDYSGGNLTAKELIFISSTEGKLFDRNNVYTTSDAGVTWTLEATLPFSPISISYNSSEGKFLLGGGDGALGLYNNADGSVLSISNSLTGGSSIQDIHFNSLSDGFIATTADVFRTADKGVSWVSLGQSNVSDIEFGTPLVGFTVNSTKSVQKTTNGGLTWSEVSTLPAGSYTTQSMNFIDANTGWFVGSNSTVFKTTDGGNTWTPQSVPVSSLTLYDVFFLDANTGYISTSGGYVFKTIDGGDNWTDTSFPESNNIFEMYWTDNNTGYLATRKIWKTTDGGASWSSDGFSPTGTISEIQFVDASTGYATFQGGEVFQTIDGGDNWSTFLEGGEIAQSLTYLEVIDVDNIWVASAKSVYNRTFFDASSPTSIGLLLPESSFCPGEEFTATFTADRQIPDENITLQLSDEFGSFASPTNIGSLAEASTFSGNIIGTIPAMITPSANYRMRAVIPSLTGSDNGENLSVGGPPNPTSFITSTAQVCKGSTGIAYEIDPVEGMNYTWSYSGTGSFNILNNGTPSITMSFFNSATSGTLSVVLSNDCGESDPLELAITVGTPNAGGTAEGGTTVCTGTSAPELSLSGHVGEVIRWEQAISPFSTYTPIANSNSATFTPSGSITETTRFRAVVQDGGCDEAISSFTVVNVAQSSIGGTIIALSGNTEISSGTSPGNLSISGHLGNVVRWEKSVAPFASYDPISNTSTLYNPGPLTVNTRFRAVVKNSVCEETESDFLEITILDETAPQVISFSPGDEDEEQAIDTNLTIEFDEDVQSTGQSSLVSVFRQSDDALLATVELNDPLVADFEDNLLTMTLSSELPYSTQVYITIPNDGIEDLNGNAFAGFSDIETWDFETMPAPDLTPPSVVSLTPSNGATGVALDANLIIEFDEDVLFDNDAATFELRRKSPDQLVESFDLFGSNVTGDNSTIVTINPTNDLEYGVEYYVLIGNEGVFIDNGDNSFGGFLTPSDWSFTAEKQDQEIIFQNIADKTFGDAPFTVIAASSSALGIDFSAVSGPISVTGNTVTITGAGEATIAANQAGNDTYNPASQVTQTFMINKADQTITIEPISDKETGDAPFDVTATSSAGLALDYAILSGPASISGNTITLSGSSGEVVVEVSQAGNTNFNMASETVSFNVNDPTKTDQTITFNAIADKTFGDLPFQISASASSGLQVDFDVQSGPISLSGNTVTINGAGQVTIVASQGGDGTFNPAPEATRSFTIAKADQLITVDPIEDKLVTDNPFDVSASVNSGLTLTYDVTGPATISGTTITLSGAAGTVTLTVSQAGNANYNQATTIETFEVTDPSKQDQVITFAKIEGKVFGDIPFDLSATSSSGLAIEFTVISGPVSINGSTLTINGAGTASIAANQAGNGNFNPAPEVIETFSIEKADQTITIQPIDDKLTSGDPFDVVATVNSGLPLDYAVTGPASISGTTITLDGLAGSVTVQVDQTGNDNYNAAMASTSFEVTEEQALALDDIEEIVIYPNPVIDFLMIDSETSVELKVFDLNGKEIPFKQIDNHTIDLSEIDPGVYILEIETSTGRTKSRIVKAN